MANKYLFAASTFIAGLVLGAYWQPFEHESISITPYAFGSLEKANVLNEVKESERENRVTSFTSPSQVETSPLTEIDKPLIKDKSIDPLEDNKGQNIDTDSSFAIEAIRVIPLNDEEDYSDVQSSQFWYKQLYFSERDEEKLSAIEELAQTGETELLAVGLGDDSTDIRLKTVQGLAQIGDDYAVQIIGQALFSEPDVKNRLSIIDALSSLNYRPHAIAFISYAQQYDKEDRVRQASRSALQ